mmetsp:Transcript_17675/g.28334  ORF Transcript_17675/g.28334 Transcript_17675/m.28334 type:complete len:210 (+) Transcript_17675:1303-1932(+)
MRSVHRRQEKFWRRRVMVVTRKHRWRSHCVPAEGVLHCFLRLEEVPKLEGAMKLGRRDLAIPKCVKTFEDVHHLRALLDGLTHLRKACPKLIHRKRMAVISVHPVKCIWKGVPGLDQAPTQFLGCHVAVTVLHFGEWRSPVADHLLNLTTTQIPVAVHVHRLEGVVSLWLNQGRLKDEAAMATRTSDEFAQGNSAVTICVHINPSLLRG